MLKLELKVAATKYLMVIEDKTINSFLLSQRGLAIEEKDFAAYKKLALAYEFSLLLFNHLREIIQELKFVAIEPLVQPVEQWVAIDFTADKFNSSFAPSVKLYAESLADLNSFSDAYTYTKHQLAIRKIFPYQLNHTLVADNISFKITSSEFLIKDLHREDLIKIHCALAGIELEFFVHKHLINYLCSTILNANNILTSTIAALLNLVRGKIMASIGIDMQIIKISEYSGVLHGDTLAINLSNELSNEYVYIKDNQLLNLQLLLPIFMQIASIFKLHRNDPGLNSALLFSEQTPIKVPIQLGSFKLTLEELQAINSGDIVFLEKLLLPPAAIEEAISAGLIAKAL